MSQFLRDLQQGKKPDGVPSVGGAPKESVGGDGATGGGTVTPAPGSSPGPGSMSWGPKRETGSPLLCTFVYDGDIKTPIVPVVPGIDVSHYQPKMNWGAVVAAGFKFAIIKATDGTGSKSSTYDKQRLDAHQNGLIVGSYHFARFGGLTPKQESEHILKVTGGVRVGELPLTIDCEWDRYNKNYDESSETMDEKAALEILEILERVESATKMTPILYCSYPFFRGFKNPERFFRFHPWNPAYWRSGKEPGKKENRINGPKVPLPWSKCAIWQWTDMHPAAKSITGDNNLDGDFFNGTLAQLSGMCRKQ